MSRSSPEPIALATTALYYVAIAALMTACLQLNGRGPIAVQLDMSGSLLFYALANAALVYGLLHLSIEGARRLPGVGRLSFLLLSNLLFTALLATMALHFVLLWRFGSALDDKILSLISEPGFFLTIGVGGLEIGVLLAALVCVYAAFVGLAALANRFGPRRRLPLLAILAPCLAIAGVERLAFGLHAYGNPDVLAEIAQRLPLHGYTRLDRLAEIVGIDQLPERLGVLDLDVLAPSWNTASYQPPPVPETISASNDFNVFYIMVESLRFDMLDPEIMPHMSALAADPKSFRALHHYSTGNSTAESMHGIFSGLSSLHWPSLAKDMRGYPAIFEIYERLGYELNLFYTSRPSYRQIDRYVFPTHRMNTRVFNKRKVGETRLEWKAHALELDDIDAVDAVLDSLDARGPGKFVDVLYLYATHYNYYFPAEDAKFRPLFPRKYLIHALFTVERSERIFNRYRNASRFVDRMCHRIIEKLRELDLLERTIVVFLGDHGEEFAEYGRTGHSTGLNRFQTKVPLIIRSPQPLRSQYTTTSHSDLSPTLLSLLSADIELGDYFGGKNLQEFDPIRDYAVIVHPMRVPVAKLGQPIQGPVGRFVLVENEHKLHFEAGPGVRPLYYTGLDDEPIERPLGSNPLRRLSEVVRVEAKVLRPARARALPDAAPRDAL